MENDNINNSGSTMYKIIIPAVLVIIVLIGVVYFFTSKSQNNTATQTAQTSQSASPTQSANKTYTLADIAPHNSESDCWMAISGNVYDVTSFISKHPGGAEILRGCGIDATSLYETQGRPNGRPHPRVADNMLKEYLIGTLQN